MSTSVPFSVAPYHRPGLNKNVKARPEVSQRPTMIFIGGIPKQATREDMAAYVENFGSLVYFSMPFDVDPDQHKGFAKVVFNSVAEEEYFLGQPRHTFLNIDMGVKKWIAKENHLSFKEKPSECKIFFRFSRPITHEQAFNNFRQFGQVYDLEIKMNYRTNEIRDFGFVTFTSVTDARNLLDHGLSHNIEGARVKLEYSKHDFEVKQSSCVKNNTSNKNSSIDEYLCTDITKDCQKKAKNSKKSALQVYPLAECFLQVYPLAEVFKTSFEEEFYPVKYENVNRSYNIFETSNYTKFEERSDTTNQFMQTRKERLPLYQSKTKAMIDRLKPTSHNWTHHYIEMNQASENLIFRISKSQMRL